MLSDLIHRIVHRLGRLAGGFSQGPGILLVALMAWSPFGLAVDCTPNDINLTSQAEVDAFQTNHGPGCDRVVGKLTVTGPDIANLDGLSGLASVFWLELTSNPVLTDTSGLSGLTTISALEFFSNNLLANLDGLSGITELNSGALTLFNNPNLSDLSGLAGLTRIGASLVIRENAALLNLDDLSNLNSVASAINITRNAALTNINGLAGVTGFDGHIDIRSNANLASLGGLEGIAGHINGLVIRRNGSLTNIDALTGVTTIGNTYSEMLIDDNASLTDLDGLANVISVNAGVTISDNGMLDDCSALAALLDDVDDGLAGPGPGPAGIPDIAGDLTLENNLAGCNSVSEITGGDVIPPQVTAPADVDFSATGTLTPVELGSAVVTDNSGEILTATPDNAGPFPVGDSLVTWSAMDSSGNTGTDTQTVTVNPPDISVPESDRPVIDGSIGYGEWDEAVHFDLVNGFMAFAHSDQRLFVLINVLADDTDDPFSAGGGDQFWLQFDINEDGQATSDLDLRFRLESVTGNLRWQTFCDGCPLGFNALESMTFSSRGEGFGCFIDDGSAQLVPLQCQSHRVWELALDLGELDMRSDRSVGFGYLVSSGEPLLTENMPPNLNDLASYGQLTLLGDVEGPGGAGIAVNPAFEVTQAAQTPLNELDLVADKRTAVRAWDGSSDSDQRYFIYGSRAGVDLAGSPLLARSRPRGQSGLSSRLVAERTMLPGSWTQAGTVDFEVLMQDLDGDVTATLSDSLDFVPTRTPVFWTVPIRMVYSDPATPPSTVTLNQVTLAEQWLARMAPIQDIEFSRRSLLTVTDVTSSTRLKEILNGYDQLVILAWALGLANNGEPPFDLPEQVTGFTGQGFTTANGRSIGGSSDRIGRGGRGRITWVRARASRTSMTYAHELNHNLDGADTSTWGLHVPDTCSSSSGGAIDPAWPYANSFLIQQIGVAPDMVRFNTVSNQTPDFMSYCTRNGVVLSWWSPYRWQAWVDEFRTDLPGKAADALQPHGESPQDSFYLQARVYPDDTGELTRVLRQPGIPDPIGAGDHRLQILDCSGSEIYSTGFSVSFVGDEGESEDFAGFTVVAPAPAEACQFVLLMNDTVLDSRVISAGAPTVTLVTPNGGEVLSGVESVQWTASDGDMDDLSFALLYSADGGMTWQPIAQGIDSQAIDVDFANLPGSTDARLRVLATDGANTGEDDSDGPFKVEASPPTVEILAPSPGASVSTSYALQLNGIARDISGQALPLEQLMWFVNGSDAGIGDQLSVYLDQGDHEITLSVGDSASTSITVTAGGAEVIGFSGDIEVDESEGESSLTVVRGGEAQGSAAVFYATMDGSAVSGGDPALGLDDYVPVAQSDMQRLEWAEGEVGERSVSIGINLDSAAEGPEKFQLLLTPANNEPINSPNATVRIRSDDPTLVFSDGFE